VDITPTDLERRYMQPRVPVIIDGLLSEWPAYHLWSRPYFNDVNEIAQKRMHYTVFDRERQRILKEYRESTLANFLKRIDAGEPLQLFAESHPWTDFITTSPVLLRAVPFANFSARLGLSIPRTLGLDPFDYRLWPWAPPYVPQLFIAGANITSRGHYDPTQDHTFHWCVWGLRSVKLLQYHHSRERELWQMKGRDFRHLPTPPLGMSGWATTLEPGQLLLMPSRTWHWFAYERPSMSFVFRARSFRSVREHCDVAFRARSAVREREHGALIRQGPLEMLPAHAHFWRKSFAARPPWPPLPDGVPAGSPEACSAIDLRSATALTQFYRRTMLCTRKLFRAACPHNIVRLRLEPREDEHRDVNQSSCAQLLPSQLQLLPAWRLL